MFLVAIFISVFLVRNLIVCDFDTSGILVGTERGLPLSSLVTTVRPLFGPLVLGVSRFGDLFGMSTLQAWQALIAMFLCLGFAACLIFCQVVDASRRVSVFVCLGWILSGAVLYLGRTLEDNLLSLPFLILAYAGQFQFVLHQQKLRFLMASGLCLAVAFLFGSSCILHLALLILPIFYTTDIKVGIRRVLLNYSVFFVSVLLCEILIWQFSGVAWPNNFGDYLYGKFPHVNMLSSSFSFVTHLRYFCLGVVASVSAFVTPTASEWAFAYQEIVTGRTPNLLVYIPLVAILIIVLVLNHYATSRTRTHGLHRFLCLQFLILSLPNFFVIDGSFIERFDYVPLFLLMSIALAWPKDQDNGNVWQRALVGALVFGNISVGMAYLVSAFGTGEMKYLDFRELARRLAGDPGQLFLSMPVREEFDLDYGMQALSLFLRKNRPVVFSQFNGKFLGYYLPEPIALVDSETICERLALPRSFIQGTASITANRKFLKALKQCKAKGALDLGRIKASLVLKGRTDSFYTLSIS